MQDLTQLRAQIDDIDAQIVRLFEQRMDVVRGVTTYKLQHGLDILQQSRETQVLQKAAGRLQNPALTPYVHTVFQTLMDVSKDMQRQMIGQRQEKDAPSPLCLRHDARIAYQGVPGAFSEQAMIDFFGEGRDARHYPSFEAVIAAVKNGERDFGVLPIDNSTTGTVNEVYDLLQQYGVRIVGEHIVKVDQHLIGLPGARVDAIAQVYSHPQGLAQCSGFFKAHPHMQQVPYPNTAMSAQYVQQQQDPQKAAIASARAARLYGLDILAPRIQDDAHNSTRFVIFQKQRAQQAGADKASVLFTLQNRPGALYRALTPLAQKQMNMIKIASRPLPGRAWEIAFYLDFEVNVEPSQLEEVLQEMQRATQTFALLGVYPREREGDAACSCTD